MRKGIYKGLLLCLFVINISSPANGKEPRIVIAYPASETSQALTYTHVIDGIEKAVGHAERLEVTEGADTVQAQLDRLHPDKVIALGKKVAGTINKTSYLKLMLVGLAHFNPTEYNGVSLTLDSRSLGAQLSRFVPSVKRVFVVQQAGHQTIESVPAISGTQPTLEIREGSDQLATIRLLGHLVGEEATATDAVFIPANLPIDILYEVAKVAWDKKIMLLSTNLAQLDTGTLMGFYPDELALGEQLGQLVTKKNPGFESTRGVNSALNRKVAQHLGIDFDPATLDLFTVKIK
jgi:hypothetical protein